MANSAPRPGRLPAVVFVLLTLGAVLVAVLHAPLKQDLAYHRFADRRTLLGVKNALDVLSNAGFAMVGAPSEARPGLPAAG